MPQMVIKTPLVARTTRPERARCLSWEPEPPPCAADAARTSAAAAAAATRTTCRRSAAPTAASAPRPSYAATTGPKRTNATKRASSLASARSNPFRRTRSSGELRPPHPRKERVAARHPCTASPAGSLRHVGSPRASPLARLAASAPTLAALGRGHPGRLAGVRCGGRLMQLRWVASNAQR